MSMFVQHGYGKANKIEELASGGRIRGVILSPGDEDQQALSDTVARVKDLDLLTLLDPQSFVYSLIDGTARCHGSHGLTLDTMHWSQDARRILRDVQAVERANQSLGLHDLMIAPSCFQTSLADVWAPVALQYARTATGEWGGDRTFMTVAVEESAFSDWDAVQEWLDVATTLDVRGVYLLTARTNSSYPTAPWDPARLTNLLRAIYSLAHVNEYEVIWGYSDIDGLLGMAAGASHIGAGWHYSLRTFSPSKWQPSIGQPRSPVARLHLGKIWTPVRAEDEASAIYASSLRSEIFPNDLATRFASGDFSTWGRVEAQKQHLGLLSRRASDLGQRNDASDRVGVLYESLERAEDRFRRLAQDGLNLPSSYSARVRSFKAALDGFVDAENL